MAQELQAGGYSAGQEVECDGASNGNDDDSQKTGHQCDVYNSCFSFDGFDMQLALRASMASEDSVASMAQMVASMASMAAMALMVLA